MAAYGGGLGNACGWRPLAAARNNRGVALWYLQLGAAARRNINANGGSYPWRRNGASAAILVLAK